MTFQRSNHILGFTLVELLVVIAVLGVLAAGVLVAINPLEQIRRGRDSAKISAVTQLGKAIASYHVSTGAYPCNPGSPVTCTVNWMTQLYNNKEIKSLFESNHPTPYNANSGGTGVPCAAGSTATYYVENGYCYSQSGNNSALVYTKLESDTYKSKGTACANSANTIYVVWNSIMGKSFIWCGTGVPNPAFDNEPVNTTNYFSL